MRDVNNPTQAITGQAVKETTDTIGYAKSLEGHYPTPDTSEQQPIISLSEAKQIAIDDQTNTYRPYGNLDKWRFLVTNSYLDNGNWNIRVHSSKPNCYECVSCDREGHYTTYIIDGNTGRILREIDEGCS